MRDFLAATNIDYHRYMRSQKWADFKKGYFRRHPKLHDRMERRMKGDLIAKMREEGFQPFVKPPKPKSKPKPKKAAKPPPEPPPWKVIPNSTPTEWVVDFGAL